jgi:hypothetical protein
MSEVRKLVPTFGKSVLYYVSRILNNLHMEDSRIINFISRHRWNCHTARHCPRELRRTKNENIDEAMGYIWTQHNALDSGLLTARERGDRQRESNGG